MFSNSELNEINNERKFKKTLFRSNSFINKYQEFKN